MNVKPGTIMGLMGENGAGKSTMMKCLFGTYQKDEGTIVLDGKEVNFSGPKDALENGVAMVHQELNQCLERSVVDNMFLGSCLLYTSERSCPDSDGITSCCSIPCCTC